MAALLPFDEFLVLLRARGYSVGVNEHLSLARLLARWPGTSSPEFGDALAALLARNEDEVSGIRRLYDQFYAPPAETRIDDGTDDSSSGGGPRERLRARTWLIAVAAAILIVALGVWGYYGRLPAPPGVPPQPAPTPPPAATATAVTVPPPTPPVLPKPLERVERRFAAELFAATFLLVLGLAWAAKTRDTKRRWLREVWSAALARLPAPYHFTPVLRDRSVRLPRADVEDAATILGRTVMIHAHTRQLDVGRTVRQTIRSGLLPRLMFKPRRNAPLILVFQDVSSEMRPWRDKIDAFLRDLARQGVPLERWYFDADLRRVSDRPLPGNVDIETVLRHRPNAPTLVVSSGGGLDALPAGDARWLKALADRTGRTWLTPVSDSRLWPERLRTLPIHVWPMTRRGLAQAARDLVGIDAEPAPQVLREIEAEGMVTTDDIERMKRLVSLVPHPRPELIEVLRRRFAPDIPDAVVLHLFAETHQPSTAVLRLPDAVVRQAAESMRQDTPRLEAMARRLLLQVLRDSEPASGSTAHQRWQLAVALQELALADLDGRDPSTIIERLSTLAQGPIWEDVRRLVRLAPADPQRSRRLDAAMRAGGRDEAPVTIPADAAGAALPWTWPAYRELAPALVSGAAVLAIAWRFGFLPVRALSNVTDAYQIDVVDTAAAAASQLRVRLDAAAPAAVPRQVTLYQDQNVYRDGIGVSDAGTTVQLAAGDGGHYYQARATLPEGNLATSPPVWIQSERLLTVLIDASPWANVSIAGPAGTIASQATPFSAALEPGVYRLRLDNGGLTPPMDQQITVSRANEVFRFTMPGFNPDSVANQLSGGGQTAK